MSDNDSDRSRSSLAVWRITALLLLPNTYVFSAGPAVWLQSHGYQRVPSSLEQKRKHSAARSNFELQWPSDRMHAAIDLVPLTPYSTDAA